MSSECHMIRTPNDVFERLNRAILFVHIVEARYLDEPADVVRVELVVHDPFRELVPFVARSTIDADAPFAVLCRMSRSVVDEGG